MPATANTPERRVLVVYNASEVDSHLLALHYAARRSIPKDRLLGVRIRNAETITRREFEEQLRQPVLHFLRERELLYQRPREFENDGSLETLQNRIHYLVLMYGLPLRISEDASVRETSATNLPPNLRRNQAAVDSELTLLPVDKPPLVGWLPNPFYNVAARRFHAPFNNALTLVARLDGPDPDTVRRMVEDSLWTERYGLHGRCYFDARNIRDGGYVEGDRWIREAAAMFQKAGYEVQLEESEALFPQTYPMSHAAVYAGWYAQNVTGPFQRDDFRFQRGAVAYHLHSGSAAVLRTRRTHWVGPLLSKGAAASFGNVYEPYLMCTPHLDLFFQRLLEGATFAEAGWYSQPALSWQTTFVGDPLYRPFAVSVEEQIKFLTEDHNPNLEWAYLRKVNLLVAGGQTNTAVGLCREKAAALNSPLLTEKLHALRRGSEKK